MSLRAAVLVPWRRSNLKVIGEGFPKEICFSILRLLQAGKHRLRNDTAECIRR
jgi:hypothetical protein